MLPSGDQAAERSIPSASSGSRCRPPPSIVKSEAVGATTDCTTRVNAIRRPSGENEGIASNGPVVSCRAAPPRAETAIRRIRSVPQYGRFRSKTRLLPPGAHTGPESPPSACRVGGTVRRRRPLPSGRTV